MADNSADIPKIVVTEGKAAGKEFVLSGRAIFEIGRATSSNIEIPDTGVAMNHCRIYKERGDFTLYDLNTTKGTFINGERITKDLLSDGDTIQIGPVVMVFRNPEAAGRKEPTQDIEIDFEPPPWEQPVKREDKDTGPIKDREPASREEPDDADVDPDTVVVEPLEAPTAGAARLTVLEGPIAGTVFELAGKSEFSIGRASEADIKIMDIKISRHHTRIMKDGAQWYAIDRDSRNGTFVNGEQISKHTLKEGDHIKVGFSIMQFNLVGSPEPAKPPKAPEPDLAEEAPPPPKKKKKKPSKRAKEKPAASPEAKTATRRRAKPKPAPAAKPDGEITCDLCSRVLSRDDLESGLAVASQDKFYCLTCVRKLGNLASGATKPSPDAPDAKDSLDDEDIDLLLKEDVQAEDEELFP